MTMMAATAVVVLILSVVMVPVTVMKPKHHVQKTAVQVETVQTVNLISLPTALNAAIQHGVNLVLAVLI